MTRGERLVLVSADPELARATAAVLEPWGVQVMTRSTELLLGATMPEAAAGAEALARAMSARAVVWMAEATGGPSLWLYDVATDRLLTVRLSSAPPFDPPTAAGLALTIKILLRYSKVAPVSERYAVPSPPGKHFALEVRAGTRIRPRPVRGWEPAFALAALFRPDRSGPVQLVLQVRAGRGFDVERNDFRGRYDDLALGLGARIGVALGRRVTLSPALGLAVHIDSLRGTSALADESVGARHLNPSLDAGLLLEIEVGRLRVGLVAEGGILLRRQRFLVGSDEVFDVPAVAGELGAALGVPLW